MGRWSLRSVCAVVFVGVVAVMGWPRGEPRAVAHAAATQATHAGSGSGPSFALGPAATSPISLVGYVPDGAVVRATSDAGTPEPSPATGRLAREITSRLCPGAARVLCAARERFACEREVGPLYDDEGAEVPGLTCQETIQTQCGAWALGHFGWYEDRFVVNEGALAACLEALRVDANGGESVALDLSCTDLARDAAREGEACVEDGYPCGENGDCVASRCEPRARMGEPCVEVPCARGLACVAGLCVHPTPRGGSCDDESVCGERGDYCVDGRCFPSAGIGGTCGYDGDCEVGARCVLGRCTRSASDSCTLDTDCGRGRTCAGEYVARCEATPNLGEPCVNEVDCAPWLACVEGRCGAFLRPDPGERRVDEPCTPGSGPWSCAGDLVCAYALDGYHCTRGTPVGERCESTQCVRDAVCVWRVVDGVCTPAICEMTDFFTGDEE